MSSLTNTENESAAAQCLMWLEYCSYTCMYVRMAGSVSVGGGQAKAYLV